ncbi:MAG TPA: amidohydrolase family protein [Pyrinomonadaceae bacterium]|jgi:beta-aspartyl-dipeptidase (metallo-type)|nr:amidohydrolase family protein [Pyrinomonadaceae bacterium]
MLTLIENGEIYAPAPLGPSDVLILGDRIAKLGEVDRRALASLGLELEIIDASGCLVTPGLIDPHEHLTGGSGERGFSTQTPEIYASELALAGITTVVGCLGVDTATKTMPALLAKAKGLNEEGLTAYIWSGGYNVPPVTLTSSVREDILFISEVIGAGEVAISDARSTAPDPLELSRLVRDAYVGGLLSKKCGVTHFHVGDERARLKLLRTLIDDYEINPALIYPTHVERNEELMREAIELAARGSYVDIDTVERDLPKWLRFYLDNGGNPSRLTASSDASINGPQSLLEQVRACVLEHGFPLEQTLALVTTNTAAVLRLARKGQLEVGRDADVLVLRKDSLEIREVIAQGRRLVQDGELVFSERFLSESDRLIRLEGKLTGSTWSSR